MPKSLKTRFILIFGSFTLVSLALIAFLSVRTIINIAESFAASQGAPVVSTVVDHINGDEFERFTQNMSEDNPYYDDLRLWMLNMKTEIGCEYLFTMAKFGNTYKYVIDGSCDPSDEDNFSPLGAEEDLESWGKAPIKSITDGSQNCSGFVKQEGWGWAISTYQGIKNSSGKIVGIVGCDFSVGFLIQKMTSEIIKIAIIALVLLAGGCGILFYLMKMLFGSLKNTSDAMEKISNGKADLTMKIPENGGLELENLAKNCNNVISNLNQLIGNLQNESGILTDTSSLVKEKMGTHISNIGDAVSSVDSISSGVNQQSSAIKKISDSVGIVENEIQILNGKITDQRSAIQQSSTAIEEISATIDSVSLLVKKITDEYDNLVKETDSGVKNQTIVNEQISTIADQSQNLTMANQAIAEIARQTNLLAMNAAIEAAHAGEFGKGFGVVADEIRVLAETSSKQSKEIKKLLATVTDSISHIVAYSETSTKSLQGVGSRISEMDELMKEIQSSMGEENIAVKNILSTVHTLNNATSAITDASNQMQKESENLFAEINDLQEIAVQTQSQSSIVSKAMIEMKDESLATLDATEKNQSAADKVVSMITGFKV